MALDYNFGDLYPNVATPTMETSLKASPEKEDQEALAENEKVSDVSSASEPKRSMIWLAIGLIVAIVILFGTGGK